ncbi:hypothetical protein RhiirA4_489348 [Rhizophagus irregularis]|uniref:Transposase domain-containing protein n=1 Tax=Rhizophagus irregularis TaxID=588596 RepID=A0A2I1HUP2_9GLOM|nr:hypothetical protein RhiirA4_489348 [Rhizophagus irregularis]
MGEGFSGFTADQSKTFILIYATIITWDLLREDDRKILSYFVHACNILVCRIISKPKLEEVHRYLLSMVKLVERSYGLEKITSNMHLCLLICKCVFDYGPLYSFWYYSFERMNGLLGSLHNSNRHIEPELLKIVQHYSLLDELSLHVDKDQHLSACLRYIAFKETVGINLFARLRLGAEVFGSTFSPRYTRSANILVQFVLNDDNTTDTWYKAADERKSRFHCQIDRDGANITNVELWKKKFYKLSRNCIIPIHNILGRFIGRTMKIGKKNPKEYLSIIPINRKIYI